jgi:hypothetical protein
MEASTKFILVTSVTVMMFTPAASGLLWPIFLVENSGTLTTRGFAPSITPKSGEFGGDMATGAMDPRAVFPSLISAKTLTNGALYSAAACRTSNPAVHAVPNAIPPSAAVSTSWPVECVHAPAVPNKFAFDDTVRLASSAVWEPVSPLIVTVDPAGKLQLSVNVTDNVTRELATGVL